MGDVAEVLAGCDDPEFIEGFLSCLLTPSETADVAARWALVKMLKQGVSHRSISRQLGVSLCKITRGSRILRDPDSAFSRFLLEEPDEEPEE